jgi:hypothetical protein
MDKFSTVNIALTYDMSNKTLKERSVIDSESTFKDFERGGGIGSGTGAFCVVA